MESLVIPGIIGGLLLVLWALVALPPATFVAVMAGATAFATFLGYLRIVSKRAKRNRAAIAQQKSLKTRAASLATRAASAAERIEQRLADANGWLDAAESEFAEGAFAPFWDAVQAVVQNLGAADQELRSLRESVYDYAKVTETIPGMPDFPITVLPSATATADRLRRVVRRGQKSFHFATIYEQRRTNQILVAGFGNLGDAVERLGGQLAGGLDDVRLRLDELIQFQTTTRPGPSDQRILEEIQQRRRPQDS